MVSLFPFTPYELRGEKQPFVPSELRSKIEPNESNSVGLSDCNAMFSNILADGLFRKVDKPCYYIYRYTSSSRQFIGLWGIHVGGALAHEGTLDEKLADQRRYRDHVGLEGSPVILTHSPNPQMQLLLYAWSMGIPDLSHQLGSDVYEFWRVDNASETSIIGELVKKVGPCYIADGHHRLSVAAGRPVSAILFASDQLEVQGYHRVVRLDETFNRDRLLLTIERNWKKAPIDSVGIYLPQKKRRIGMWLGGKWYQLDFTAGNGLSPTMSDTELLHKTILSDGMDIQDGRDGTIDYYPDQELALLKKELINERSVVFTLFPVSVAEILGMADAGRRFPAKSTWIEPRAPYGIIVNDLQIYTQTQGNRANEAVV